MGALPELFPDRETSAASDKENIVRDSSNGHRISDHRSARFDAERPFIDLLESALDLPADKRPAFIRTHSRDSAMSDVALECLGAMDELG
ncbi:MAG: hypothetical protein GY719_41470 [bacterium]|nr:hypothetical protein [bacterium]